MPWMLLAGCGSDPRPATTVAEHEHMASHYDATAESIEVECFRSRRAELTVDDPSPCWKAQDIRFLEANRNAAAQERAAAKRLRAAEGRAPASARR